MREATLRHLRDLVERPELDAGDAGRYEVLDRIGEGGMGAVYRARDRALGREVALKVLRAPAPTDEERARLLREARVLAGLEHPGIVPVHDVGTLADGRPFYVMKRVRGERLDAYARRDGGAPRAELLRAFRHACDAVAFAHAAGVVHRDLKPQNVMLGPFGEVLVLDWGVAKVRGDASVDAAVAAPPVAAPDGPADGPADGPPDTTTGTVLGTPGYMAPEQRVGASADARADVYGLGGILHFLLTGAHPGAADDDARLDAAPAPLRAICRRARAADPAARYPSATALAADVANWQDALPVSAHREGPLERARRVLERHRTAALLVLAYLLMRVALLAAGGR